MATVTDSDVDVVIVASWSAEERARREKALVRKVDIRLLPILCFMYILNYIDRNALPHARVQGIEEDLGLTGYEYNIVLSITFAGYISMQVPSNMILSLVRPSWYLGGWMVAWGTVSALTGAVQDFQGLAACRFILGVTEAPFFVGCAFLFSGWYTRRELGLRLGIFFAAAMFSGAFGGLFAAGVAAAFASAPGGLESWRWLFIIEGAVTVVAAIVTIAVIPDWPATTKWLSPEERVLGVARLVEDAGEEGEGENGEEEIGSLQGLRMAVADYRVWLCILVQVCLQAVASVANFLPTLVEDFGYGEIETLLLTAPPYVLTGAACIAVSGFSDRLSLRAVFILGPCLVALVGVVVSMATTNIAARYVAIFLILSGSYSCFQVSNAWMANIAARPRKKRAVGLALNTAFGNSAMIWTPYLYPETDGPRYFTAWSVNLGLAVLCLGTVAALRVCLSRDNQVIDRLCGSSDMSELGVLGVAAPSEDAKMRAVVEHAETLGDSNLRERVTGGYGKYQL